MIEGLYSDKTADWRAWKKLTRLEERARPNRGVLLSRFFVDQQGSSPLLVKRSQDVDPLRS